MDLQDIGEILRKERRRQGLSLEEVHATTKIGLDILQAMEGGIQKELPHPVYTRGFIKGYAEFLGLSPEELAQAFDRAIQGSTEQEEEPGAAERTGRQKQPGGGRSWPSVGLALVLLIILGLLVYIFLLAPPKESGGKEAAGTEKEVNATRNETGAVASREKGEPSAVVPGEPIETGAQEDNASRANGTAKQQTAGTRSPAADTENATNQTVTSEGEADNATQEDEQGTLTGDRTHELRIVAFQACWVRAELNGEARDIYLEPGEETTFSFRESGTFLLGNAGGVTLFVDGNKRTLEADPGEVKEITLP